ncbi:MAG: hypothetical protein GY841_24080 [FCB group bacterium]|nr:hypothetical protein [FCB group bacterium]
MTTWVIPIVNAAEDGVFSQSVTMDGVEFILDFYWSDRAGFWYFDLLDANEDLIKAGIKLVTNQQLIWRVSDPRRPAGEIIALDTRETDIIPAQDPGLTDLGTNIELIYIDSDDVS